MKIRGQTMCDRFLLGGIKKSRGARGGIAARESTLLCVGGSSFWSLLRLGSFPCFWILFLSAGGGAEIRARPFRF